MKWGLPRDYPMVALSYASTRSVLAKQIGLGRKTSADTVEPEIAETDEVEVTAVKARRARKAKG